MFFVYSLLGVIAVIIGTLVVVVIFAILADLFGPSVGVLLSAIKPRVEEFGEYVASRGKTMAEWLERKLKGKG